MRKKAKKLLALLLCLMMLLPTMGLSAFAAGKASGSTGSNDSQPSSSEIGAILNALSYDEYRETVLSKHTSVGNMTFYSQLGEKLGTATVANGVASVFVYNGNEYKLSKLGKNSYAAIGGEYEICNNMLNTMMADIDANNNNLAVVVDKALQKISGSIDQLISTLTLPCFVKSTAFIFSTSSA